ncbi:MAG: hypothetical protein CL902_09290 [Dehalococcoidia bacterium]|nr:hypothetical protein [Dehalococcoidia bacterium]
MAVDQSWLAAHLPANHKGVAVPEFYVQIFGCNQVDLKIVHTCRNGADGDSPVLGHGFVELSRTAGRMDKYVGTLPGIIHLDRAALIAKSFHYKGVLCCAGDGDGFVSQVAVYAIPTAPGDGYVVVITGGLSLTMNLSPAAVSFPADHEDIAIPEFDIQVCHGCEVDGKVCDPNRDLADERVLTLWHILGKLRAFNWVVTQG